MPTSNTCSYLYVLFEDFVNKELEGLPNKEYIKKNASYVYDPDNGSYIRLTTFGSDKIEDETRNVLVGRFRDYPTLIGAKLLINQATFNEANNLDYMEELRYRDSLDLMSQKEKIIYLQDKVAQLSKLEKDQIPIDEIGPEVRINFEKIKEFSYTSEIRTNFKKIDTLKVFEIKWNDSLATAESKPVDQQRLSDYLKERLNLDTLIVRVRND